MTEATVPGLATGTRRGALQNTGAPGPDTVFLATMWNPLQGVLF